MKSIVTTLTVILLTCGVTYGQDEPGPGFEHLKCYGPFIGTWRYEGPVLEDLPGIAEKGTKIVIQASWRRILNRSAVETNWSLKFEGGAELAVKGLYGWNADEKQIVYGSMDSLGSIQMGTVTPDAAAKSTTLNAKGVDSEGKKISVKAVLTKTGKDTLTWQALERTGGIAEGRSPEIMFKRVERAKKAAK
jgi:hypothetical protein